MKNENLRKALLSSIDYSVISTPKFATAIATGVVSPDYLVTERHYSRYSIENVGFDTSIDKAEEYMVLASTQIKEAINLTIYVPDSLEDSMKIICDGWEDLFGSNITTTIVTFDPNDYETVIEENSKPVARETHATLPVFTAFWSHLSVSRSFLFTALKRSLACTRDTQTIFSCALYHNSHINSIENLCCVMLKKIAVSR